MDEFEKFMSALPNCDTVKVVLTGCGEEIFHTKEIYESIIALLDYILEKMHWCPFKDEADIDFDKECVGFGESGCRGCVIKHVVELIK